MMLKIIDYILDFIFPPNINEVEIRNINKEELYSKYSFKNEWNSSIYPYQEPIIKELVWQIKYKRNKKAIEIAGYSLYCELIKHNQPLLLIPIPISKERRRERGYNQCELMIDEIIKLDKDKIFKKDFDFIIRNRNIEKQTHKNRKERIVNSQKIFSLVKSIDKNQRIVVIDDVTTTGSTLNEANRCLDEGGYNNIMNLTLTH